MYKDPVRVNKNWRILLQGYTKHLLDLLDYCIVREVWSILTFSVFTFFKTSLSITNSTTCSPIRFRIISSSEFFYLSRNITVQLLHAWFTYTFVQWYIIWWAKLSFLIPSDEYMNIPRDLGKNSIRQTYSCYLSSLVLKPDLNNTNAKACFSWKFFSNLLVRKTKHNIAMSMIKISGKDGERKNIYAFFLLPPPVLAPRCFTLMFQADLLLENLIPSPRIGPPQVTLLDFAR